ncbi:hypothetical protein BpHYR1_050266 [Brachionus plicatilis]|uniref:Uncharacterized protein n=1 Tax=Brachionus plicatilis TaxID=10195 RepID=A0A3M7RW21_BRAPC|nr:hypothetical protein BpHYR1_050266 [Brachionus plicatilis]
MLNYKQICLIQYLNSEINLVKKDLKKMIRLNSSAVMVSRFLSPSTSLPSHFQTFLHPNLLPRRKVFQNVKSNIQTKIDEDHSSIIFFSSDSKILEKH